MAINDHVFRKLFAETRQQWAIMTLYERFEQVVAIILSLVIALVIALALVQLLVRIAPLLLTGAIDPMEHDVFQRLFGMVMTLLIALEFKHSIIRVALRKSSIVQVKTVVLIALIALSRKFVILDTKATSASTIAALAGATLVLGVVYWLLRDRDDRLIGTEGEGLDNE
ncbi:MAG: phosphate-starvation-inducible PsiE family protein [Telluria sp.]